MRIVMVALCVVACGSKTPATRVVDAEISNLADCKIVQRVSGTSSGTGEEAGTRAKNDARKQAAALGATHIRWIVPCCTSVEGDAYRCDLPQ